LTPAASCAFVVASIIVDTPRSLAATNDPASFVGDLGSRAIAGMRNEDTEAAKQERFRQLSRQYLCNNGRVQPLLIGMHEKNVSNGTVR
jgi:hypothetical protein